MLCVTIRLQYSILRCRLVWRKILFAFVDLILYFPDDILSAKMLSVKNQHFIVAFI